MTSITFGPIGLLHRGRIRDMAFRLGLALDENRGFLQSTFRASGKAGDVDALANQVRRLAEDEARADHLQYVADMERAEKRRVRRGALMFRRLRRDTEFSRDESTGILDLLVQAARRQTGHTEDAGGRLSKGIAEMRRVLDLAVSDETASTIADVRLRYLQHDIRRKDLELPRELRARILAVRPTYDTWSE